MLNFGALMMFQTQADVALDGHDVHLLMIFVGIIMVALVVQAIGFVSAGMVGIKLLAKAEEMANNADRKTAPVLAKANALLDDLAPKVRAITTDVEEISSIVRAKCEEVGETVTEIKRTVDDINGRTRVQVRHVDGIVTSALNTTEEVSAKVQQGIRYPVNQVVGIIAGLKAGLETLAQRSPFGKKDVRNPYDL